jgi:hypothetical protein
MDAFLEVSAWNNYHARKVAKNNIVTQETPMASIILLVIFMWKFPAEIHLMV